jgi:hypothetical protein
MRLEVLAPCYIIRCRGHLKLDESFAKCLEGTVVGGSGFAANLPARAIPLTLTGNGISLRLVCQPKARRGYAGESYAQFLQRRAAGDRLGQGFGEFIEFVAHVFYSLVFFCSFASIQARGPGLENRHPLCVIGEARKSEDRRCAWVRQTIAVGIGAREIDIHRVIEDDGVVAGKFPGA